MDRRDSIKTLLMGTFSVPFANSLNLEKEISSSSQVSDISEPMHSDWAEWPDMPWAGPRFWGNRLQDWRISNGKIECIYNGGNRSLHCLTHQLDKRSEDFNISVEAEMGVNNPSEKDYIGLRLGAIAKDEPVPVTFSDYRRDAVFGKGLDAGITGNGRLFIGENKSSCTIVLESPIRLEVHGEISGRLYKLVLKAKDVATGRHLGQLVSNNIAPGNLTGNVALVSHFPSQAVEWPTVSSRFSDWRLSGSKFVSRAGQAYGPICFAQYTLNRSTLKVTAQLASVEAIPGHKVTFQIRDRGKWRSLEEITMHALARTVHFRVEKWSYSNDVPYRILLELPLNNTTRRYTYEGTVASEPVSAEKVKAAMFSCNYNWGFPNSEVVRNVAKHQPDMAIFLGDQFYEGHPGLGVERTQNLELATLDYLNHWYMFGWSYRDIFRHIPSVFIPDDHDVYHGNLWGDGGRQAPVEEGYGYMSQDEGGYHMPGDWVKMVERTQTSHLPDPFDPTPVKQDIGVYYTDWTYGGVSFAIIEDRKFKSAPDDVLPFDVQNGFPQDPEIDFTRYYNIEADLLGERQHRFLEEWTKNWGGETQLKVVLSQSPFCGAHTMPPGTTGDLNVPERPIPERGEYPQGDVPAPDMDTNGWPQKQRDQALRIIRKSFAFHVAGDQHLASILHYGVDNFGDAGYVFTLPALNNVWPRRWWPTVEKDHKPLPGQPKYTGNFRDAFDNKITVLSVANPVKTGMKPGVIYDRAPGYGILIFDKEERVIRSECWPRHVDPIDNPEGQYGGWPVIINQQENYGRYAYGYLPEIEVKGLKDPVLQVFKQETGELEYALRIKGQSFRPEVYENTRYSIRIGEPDKDIWKEFHDLRPRPKNNSTTKIKYSFDKN
ncbi:alkaline phosphatase D family protein [Halalkalibaculum sp. DA384]|uniref:alkaline phosphatase D family protein n=1 Tax=Halalkalibaculum sp. DA384 TaxID=3373606 RepID=UPI003754FF6A